MAALRQLLTTVWRPAHEHGVRSLRLFFGQLGQKHEHHPGELQVIPAEAGGGLRL